jgi:uncharacterized membrane protein
MTTTAHLWAISYDDVERAEQVPEKIAEPGWGTGRAGKYLDLFDLAVVVQNTDGRFTFDRKPFPGVTNVLAFSAVGFLAGLVLVAPLTGAAIGALLGTAAPPP